MIFEFEQRFVDVLGQRLADPFTGRIDVAPGLAVHDLPRLALAVSRISPLDPDFHSRRPEVVPGSPDLRRVLRLECTVTMNVRPPEENAARADQIELLDATLFALGDAEILSGRALDDGTDRGFLIQNLRLSSGDAPVAPTAQAPVCLNVIARGLFWPVGASGENGVPIEDVLIRGALLPIEVIPPAPFLAAAGPPVELIMRIRTLPGVRIARPPGVPLDSLRVAVFAANGAPGAGVLAGGAEATPGVRVIPLAGGQAAVTYTPPAEPGIETLVLFIQRADGSQGLELQRVPLTIRGT